MKKIAMILGVSCALLSGVVAAPQGVGEKMKRGAGAVVDKSKEVGSATAGGTKNVARKVRKGAGTAKNKTVSGAKTTKRVTKTGIRKVGSGTEKTGKAIKKAGQ